MHTYPLEAYMVHVRSGDWVSVAELMIDSAVILARCGAEFAICPDNTIHRAFDRVVEGSPIPWLNMVDTVAAAAKEQGFQKLGITGTKNLTTGPVYADALKKYQLEHAIPDEEVCDRIDRISSPSLYPAFF